MRKQKGFNVTEVLISLLLVSVLMTLLLQFYVSSKRQFIEVEKILDNEFDVRFVMELLKDSIRRAGFTPCLALDQLETLDFKGHSEQLFGIEIKEQSMQINRMYEYFSKLVTIQDPTHIIVEHAAMFHQHNSLIIADCHHAEIHELVAVEKQESSVRLTLKEPLAFTYPAQAYVGKLIQERFFIKKNGAGDEALYYHLNQTEELTKAIHSLQVYVREMHNKLVLEVLLGVNEAEVKRFKVAVRGT